MTNITALRDILTTEAGKPLKDFLLEHYMRLNSLEGVKQLDNANDQAIELKATKKALEVIRSILEDIMSVEQVKADSTNDKDKFYQL